MKRIAVTNLFLTFLLLGYGQTKTEINQTDSTGLKQGYWEEQVNRSVAKGSYLDGEKEGIWRLYWPKGFLREIICYENGVKNGPDIGIDQRGYLNFERFFKNGQPEGPAKEYTYGGNLTAYKEYRSGVLHGVSKSFYEHRPGRMLEKSRYENGKKHGLSEWFDEKGNPIARYQYANGLFEGEQLTYYGNGEIMTKEMYHLNIPESYQAFYENGQLKESGSYKEGKKHGKWYYYDKEGHETKVEKYKNGELK
jgi:antitoxin component YwqK of YwqJK toxin-antitoxin module